MSSKVRLMPILGALFLSLIFASLLVVARELNKSLTIQQQVYGRSFIALLLVVAIYYKQFSWRKIVKIPRKDIYLGALRGLLIYVGAVSLISYAAVRSTVFLASVLGSIPFAAAFGVIFFKERLTWLRLVSLTLAFVGIIIMNNPFGASLHLGKGEVAAIFSSIFFSLAYVMRKLHSKNITNPQISSLMYASGTLGLIILSLVIGQGFLRAGQLNFHTVVWLVIGGLFNLANIMLVNYVYSELPALVANTLLLSEFAFAVLIGFSLYREIPGLWEIGGTLLIMGSIGALAYNEQKTRN